MAINGEAKLLLKTVFGEIGVPAHLTAEYGSIPITTYKYLDINSCYTRCSLKGRYAYFSNPTEFNDPFDRVIPIAYHLLGENDELFINYFSAKLKRADPLASSERISQQVSKLLKDSRSSDDMKELFMNIAAKSRQYLDELVSSIAVYCTSLEKDNILLWSHYADKHTGICLGINTYELLTTLKCAGGMVKYGQYPIINPFDEYDEAEAEKNYELMFLSKGEFWNYECEYRFSIFECSDRKQYFGSCIESLILGSGISPQNREYAIRTCKAINPEIEIFEAKKKDFFFKLDIAKVDI